MTLRELEERVTALERELASLRDAQTKDRQGRDWRSMFDFFDKHPGMHVVFEEAMKRREKDRAKAKRGKSNARRTKT
jgi:hypothetical protein